MQNFQRNWEMQSSAGSKAKGVISGVGKGIVGVFTKPIGGAAELVSQTGYGEFWMVKDNSMLNESVTVFSFVGLFHMLIFPKTPDGFFYKTYFSKKNVT